MVGLGQTTNLGVGGVFVTAPVLPPLGSPIMFEMNLPRFGTTGGDLSQVGFNRPEIAQESFVLLTAEGLVLRHHEEGTGFAASISQTSFVHQDEREFA